MVEESLVTQPPQSGQSAGKGQAGEDYPNLDELLRQLPSPAAGFFLAQIQEKMLPRLGRFFQGVRDDQGKLLSGLDVRDIGYDVAVNLIGMRQVMPDVVALAGGQKQLPTGQPGGETSTATDSLESAPCLPPN